MPRWKLTVDTSWCTLEKKIQKEEEEQEENYEETVEQLDNKETD